MLPREDTHFRLRLPHDLKDYVRDQAQRNQRSMTGEIVFLLRQSQERATGTA